MIRPEIGVTTFLNSAEYKPWPCIFKEKYSDFIVLEVLSDGTCCKISDGSSDVVPGKKEVKEVVMPSRLSEEDKEKLGQLKELGEVLISVEGWTKDERRELHEYVRSLGPYDSKVDGQQIKAFKPSNVGRKRKFWPRDVPEQLHFTLSKADYETSYAIGLISKFLYRTPDSFGYCGLKDRRAVTAQRVSGFHVDALDLLALNSRLKGITVSAPKYEDKRLSLGNLWGNRFEVALRQFEMYNDEGLKDRIDEWSNNGFINYFGEQRFGSFSISTAEIGLKIIQKDYETAVNMILEPKENTKGSIGDCLKTYKETKDPKSALKQIQGNLNHLVETYVLKQLQNTPTNFKAAILAIPRPQRSLYVHAYQSKIFNQIASKRAEKFGLQVLPGDLFQDESKLVTDSGDDITNVVLPLPSNKMRIPQNEIGEWYKEIMDKDKLTENDFRDLHKDFAVTESFRNYVAKPRDVEYDLIGYNDRESMLQSAEPFAKVADGELQKPEEGKYQALRVNFSLPSGCYATIALRELLRVDLSKSAQREATANSRDVEPSE
ncbi:unnamed protein product [Bursaphelenchus okinawaensis]|uniref:TRUD domain-containing protein n=1 Tax=Bursaphelenchus okinawaensis TaxID=465554 RepID=A0A811KRP9_9BILA|nr:unnamed protein product [Bursaphelenchus okinawaensis]CAG9111918.1 unnamed protein product [Bursaphelenchus okinawaensis]